MNVAEVLGNEITNSLPNKFNNNLTKFEKDYAKVGAFNLKTGETVLIDQSQMAGITKQINEGLAQEILERAKYYCPKDTGYLASTGHIDYETDGTCRITFDCPYAWYVHELTYRNHDYPTSAKFLDIAIQEIYAKYGLPDHYIGGVGFGSG